MYQELIVTGAWWDFVDEVAIRHIGREYAKTDPSWVPEFVRTHPNLSPLSRREATKHLSDARE
jgi:3-methyladenine DNA glycosylase AlkD